MDRFCPGAVLALAVAAAVRPAAEPSVRALRATETVRVDGGLEGCRPAPERTTGGEPATELTAVSVLYDERNLYVGVHAFDREPDQVIARTLRRDTIIGLDRKWVTSLRLRFIHRPESDLYVVFNDEQGEGHAPVLLVNRGFAIKGTWRC